METDGCRGKVIREIVEIKESEEEGEEEEEGQGQGEERPGREEEREKMFSMFKGMEVN